MNSIMSMFFSGTHSRKQKEQHETQSSGRYKVLVDDNFHFMDASERYTLGEYKTLEEATVACKRMVDDFLIDASASDSYKNSTYKPGTASENLYAYYVMFGEDPFIVPRGLDLETHFSAWNYAKQRCADICGA